MPANQIIPNLYIGDIDDAWTAYKRNQVDVMINVLEDPRTGILSDQSERVPGEIWMPIAKQDSKGFMHADRKKLDRVAETIEQNLKARKIVLVHCVAGRERSPLAVIWFLHTKRRMPIEAAYKVVKRERPQTSIGILTWLH